MKSALSEALTDSEEVWRYAVDEVALEGEQGLAISILFGSLALSDISLKQWFWKKALAQNGTELIIFSSCGDASEEVKLSAIEEFPIKIDDGIPEFPENVILVAVESIRLRAMGIRPASREPTEYLTADKARQHTELRLLALIVKSRYAGITLRACTGMLFLDAFDDKGVLTKSGKIQEKQLYHCMNRLLARGVVVKRHQWIESFLRLYLPRFAPPLKLGPCTDGAAFCKSLSDMFVSRDTMEIQFKEIKDQYGLNLIDMDVLYSTLVHGYAAGSHPFDIRTNKASLESVVKFKPVIEAGNSPFRKSYAFKFNARSTGEEDEKETESSFAPSMSYDVSIGLQAEKMIRNSGKDGLSRSQLNSMLNLGIKPGKKLIEFFDMDKRLTARIRLVKRAQLRFYHYEEDIDSVATALTPSTNPRPQSHSHKKVHQPNLIKSEPVNSDSKAAIAIDSDGKLLVNETESQRIECALELIGKERILTRVELHRSLNALQEQRYGTPAMYRVTFFAMLCKLEREGKLKVVKVKLPARLTKLRIRQLKYEDNGLNNDSGIDSGLQPKISGSSTPEADSTLIDLYAATDVTSEEIQAYVQKETESRQLLLLDDKTDNESMHINRPALKSFMKTARNRDGSTDSRPKKKIRVRRPNGCTAIVAQSKYNRLAKIGGCDDTCEDLNKAPNALRLVTDLALAPMLRTKVLHLWMCRVVASTPMYHLTLQRGEPAILDMYELLPRIPVVLFLNCFGYAEIPRAVDIRRYVVRGVKFKLLKDLPVENPLFETLAEQGSHSWFIPMMLRSLEILCALTVLTRCPSDEKSNDLMDVSNSQDIDNVRARALEPFRLGKFKYNRFSSFPARSLESTDYSDSVPILSRQMDKLSSVRDFWDTLQRSFCSITAQQLEVLTKQDTTDVLSNGVNIYEEGPDIGPSAIPELGLASSWEGKTPMRLRSRLGTYFTEQEDEILINLVEPSRIPTILPAMPSYEDIRREALKMGRETSSCAVRLRRLVKLRGTGIKQGQTQQEKDLEMKNFEYLSQARLHKGLREWNFTASEAAAVSALKQALLCPIHCNEDVASAISKSLSRFSEASLFKGLLYLWGIEAAALSEMSTVHDNDAYAIVNTEIQRLLKGEDQRRFAFKAHFYSIAFAPVDTLPNQYPPRLVSEAKEYDAIIDEIDTDAGRCAEKICGGFDMRSPWARGGYVATFMAEMAYGGLGVELKLCPHDGFQGRIVKGRGKEPKETREIDLNQILMKVNKLDYSISSIGLLETYHAHPKLVLNENLDVVSYDEWHSAVLRSKDVSSHIIDSVFKIVASTGGDGMLLEDIHISEALPSLLSLEKNGLVMRVMDLEKVRWVTTAQSQQWLLSPLIVQNNEISAELLASVSAVPWVLSNPQKSGQIVKNLRRHLVGHLMRHAGATVQQLTAEMLCLSLTETRALLASLVHEKIVVVRKHVRREHGHLSMWPEDSKYVQQEEEVEYYSVTPHCLKLIAKSEDMKLL